MTRRQSPFDEAKRQDGQGRMLSVLDEQQLNFLSRVETLKNKQCECIRYNL